MILLIVSSLFISQSHGSEEKSPYYLLEQYMRSDVPNYNDFW